MNLTEQVIVNLLNDSQATIAWVKTTILFNKAYFNYLPYTIAIPQAVVSSAVILILVAASNTARTALIP